MPIVWGKFLFSRGPRRILRFFHLIITSAVALSLSVNFLYAAGGFCAGGDYQARRPSGEGGGIICNVSKRPW